MPHFSFFHLDDGTLARDLKAVDSRERGVTAEWLAYVAEFDARRLYAQAGYASMFSYCVHELGRSEETVGRRIHAARTARKFPILFHALADGRIHMTAITLLAPWLTHANVEELVACAARKTKAEIEQFLAERFPRADVPTRLVPLVAMPVPASPPIAAPIAMAPLAEVARDVQDVSREHSLANVDVHVAAPAEPSPAEVRLPRPRITPLSAEHWALQATLSKVGREALQRILDLSGHELAPGDIDQALERALVAYAGQLEKQKCAATDRPGHSRQPREGSRHVPASVKRAVWERDGGRCTFVSDDGVRCPSRRALELDHVEPVARGGTATVSGVRLLCRTHNQLEAERVFGGAFMAGKREGSRTAIRPQPTACAAARRS